jgi:nicotinamide mononucleotide (NMN) deamidase PncC
VRREKTSVSTISQEQLAEEVHAQGTRLVIAVTGGGSGAISALLTTRGASRSILAATVPYAPAALSEWLGARPDEFCSAWTARAMAMAAFLKARQYDPDAVTCGVACTASLASDRPKRGPHRAHFAFQTAGTTAALSLELEKGRRSRFDEEAVVAAVMLNHVADACGAKGRIAVPLVVGESIQSTRVVAPPDRQDLLAGRRPAIPLRAAGDQARPRAVFPGAFNPLHDGHKTMAAAAQQILGQEVTCEISILNVDKPPLDFIEIDRRARQFSPGQAVWLTRAPHFSEKARLFPGATFVVGADTLARVGHPRYYGGQEAAMHQAIADIASHGCRFLVFGRTIEGTFRTLGDLQIPAALLSICQEVPEKLFRDDISSTQLRSQEPRE